MADVEAAAAVRTAAAAAATTAKYAGAAAPSLHTTHSTVDAVRAVVEAVRARDLDFDKPARIAKPPPDFDKFPAVVRYNAGALRREDARWRAEEHVKELAVAAAAAGGRGPLEFFAWKAEAERREREEEIRRIEDRKLVAAAATDAAREAVEARVRAAAGRAAIMRNHRELVEQFKVAQQKATVDAKRAIAEDIRSSEFTGPEAIRTALFAAAKSRRDAARSERDALEAEIANAAAVHTATRAALAARIRAMEAARPPRPLPRDSFDPGTVASAGISLEEMSLAELRERIVTLGIEAEAEEEARRGAIFAKKEAAAASMEEVAARVFAGRAKRRHDRSRARRK